MSTTITMSITEARRRLQDTSRMSPEQVDELEQIVARFHGSRPLNRACVACGAMRWSQHSTADGDASWACDGCHRPASLTAEEWHAQCTAAEAVRQVHAARAAAAPEPDPRTTLAEALAARREATTAFNRLEHALAAAREAVTLAMSRHAAALAAQSEAEQSAVTQLAAGLLGGKPAPSASLTDAARGRLRLAEDSLAAAQGARQLIDDRLLDARRAVANADAALRTAALRVIAAEELEGLITAAVEARAAYVESVSALSWLVRNHAVPNGDLRPSQLVRGADTPPAQWPEAADADGGMTARLNALLGDAP